MTPLWRARARVAILWCAMACASRKPLANTGASSGSSGGMTSASSFHVIATTPADGAAFVPGDVVVQLSFDQSPDPSSLAANTSLSDGIRTIAFTAAVSGTVATLTPQETLAGDTFQVTLSQRVTSNDRNVLVPYAFSFRTAETPRLIFVSSATGNANLSTWAAAGGKVGAEAADTVCQTLAQAAGRLGTFRAWLSTSSDDAYCRIVGASGKKSDTCGAETLPAGAGPWSNTLGLPFAGDIAQLAGGGTFYAANYDETGAIISPNDVLVFTATSAAGALIDDGQTCADWKESTGAIAHVGNAYGGISWWSNFGEQACSAEAHLWCVQTGSDSTPVVLAASGNTVFIHPLLVGGGNAEKWPGGDGTAGLAAADRVCQNAAANAGLTNASRFKAWLSTSSVAARDHITSEGPWVRVDHVSIAADRTQLLSGRLQAAIEVDEHGNFAASQVLTGTDATGVTGPQTCDDWSSVSGSVQATIGVAMLANAGWTDDFAPDCDETYAIYCFED